jgi:hypothetical protein
MNGLYAKEYWKVAQLEIETLERIQAWTVVPRTNDITNVLPSTWTFKVKRDPDESVKKFKGCFCARGNKQIHGVDFFETYSLVVQYACFGMYPGSMLKAGGHHLCLSACFSW